MKQTSNVIDKNQWNVSSQWVKNISPMLYIFFIVWLLGSCWRAFNVSQAFWQTRQLLLSSVVIKPQESLAKLTNIKLLASNHINTPMVTGFIQPVIILPQFLLQKFSAEQLKPIILHELAHVERKDPYIGIFQETIAIIFWWSPIMRIVNRKIHLNRELACDMRAANKLASSKKYAQSLVDCAKLMLSQHSNVLAMGLFSHKKDLSLRINEVLKMKYVKHPSLFITIIACLSLGIATISFAQQHLPKINLSNIQLQANHFSELSEQESEMLVDIIEKNDLQALQTMIDSGLDINKPIKGEGTALIIAVDDNNLFMINQLMVMATLLLKQLYKVM